jgi:hypothetical protein
VGSQSKINLAYIAGFLDGDGSLMLQIKKRKDCKLKRRFMATICFYQDSRHEKSLHWIKKVLGIGFISRRNDGMTELRINGFKQTKEILENLMPFVKFKSEQAKALYSAVSLLNEKETRLLEKKDLLKLTDFIMTIQENNYVTRKKKTKADILRILGLTP